MGTLYPGALDNSTSLPNPLPNQDTNAPSLSSGQTTQNAALIAVESKIGTGASTPTSGTVLSGTGVGTSAWGAAPSPGVGSILPQSLVAGTGTSWVWQDWTPTWSNLTVSDGTIVAKYIQIGKTVFYAITATAGSMSALPTSGLENVFSLPVPSVAGLYAQAISNLGAGVSLNVSFYFTVASFWYDANNAILKVPSNVFKSGTLSSDNRSLTYKPFNQDWAIDWNSGDIFSVQGFYQAA